MAVGQEEVQAVVLAVMPRTVLRGVEAGRADGFGRGRVAVQRRELVQLDSRDGICQLLQWQPHQVLVFGVGDERGVLPVTGAAIDASGLDERVKLSGPAVACGVDAWRKILIRVLRVLEHGKPKLFQIRLAGSATVRLYRLENGEQNGRDKRNDAEDDDDLEDGRPFDGVLAHDELFFLPALPMAGLLEHPKHRVKAMLTGRC